MGCGGAKLRRKQSVEDLSTVHSVGPEEASLRRRLSGRKWGEWEELVCEEGGLVRSELLLFELLEHEYHWCSCYHWYSHYRSLVSQVGLVHCHLWLQSVIVLFPHQQASLCAVEGEARETLTRVQRLAFERIMEEQYVSWLIRGGLDEFEEAARIAIISEEYTELNHARAVWFQQRAFLCTVEGEARELITALRHLYSPIKQRKSTSLG